MFNYNPYDWYWIVDDDTQVYSIARAEYVSTDDIEYRRWLSQGNFPTRIKTEAELWEVLRQANVPPHITCTPLQFDSAIEQLGYADAVDALIEDPETPRKIRHGFWLAQEMYRFDDNIIAAAQQLGISDSDMNSVFELAITK